MYNLQNREFMKQLFIAYANKIAYNYTHSILVVDMRPTPFPNANVRLCNFHQILLPILRRRACNCKQGKSLRAENGTLDEPSTGYATGWDYTVSGRPGRSFSFASPGKAYCYWELSKNQLIGKKCIFKYSKQISDPVVRKRTRHVKLKMFQA